MLSHNVSVDGTGGENNEDARSLVREFWALLNAGAPSEASDIARCIAPTPVGSFTFPDAGGTGVARGTSTGDAPLYAGTPGVVDDAWSSEQKVSLLQANPKWCRAPIASGTSGTPDFKVCSVEGCVKTAHQDVGGEEENGGSVGVGRRGRHASHLRPRLGTRG